MPDLPDWYTLVSEVEAEAFSLRGGADTAKSATPVARDIYLATDTKKLYICVADGVWTGFDASMLIQGILTLYENMDANSKKIINLAAPTANNDAARKAYIDTLHALQLLLTGGTMSGDIAMGNNIVSGLKAPTADNDAARKKFVDDLHALQLLLTGGTLTGNLTIVGDWIGMFFNDNAARQGSLGQDNTGKLAFSVVSATLGWQDVFSFVRGVDNPDLTLYRALLATNLNANSHKITGLAAPTVAGDAARKNETDLLTPLATFNNHSARHEDTGADEISVAGLSGELADDQKVKSHGAAKHTDVTREVFLPVIAGHVAAGTPANQHRMATVNGAANANEPDVYLTMKVPDDFVSFLSVKAVWLIGGTGNMYWRISASYGTTGESSNNHTDEPALALSAIAASNQIYMIEPANALTLANLAAGDILGLNPYREGSDGSDTIDQTCILFGLIFEYTAEQ